MDVHEQHIIYAFSIGGRIEEILRRHGIHTECHVTSTDSVFAACWEATRANVTLEWSIGSAGGDDRTDYLAVLLRIDRPENPDITLQQFKLLLALSSRTWHSSTAGQLGFALNSQPNLDEARAMEMVERMAQWFCNPQSHIPALLPTSEE